MSLAFCLRICMPISVTESTSAPVCVCICGCARRCVYLHRAAGGAGQEIPGGICRHGHHDCHMDSHVESGVSEAQGFLLLSV